MELRILGPLEVVDGKGSISLGGPKQRPAELRLPPPKDRGVGPSGGPSWRVRASRRFRRDRRLSLRGAGGRGETAGGHRPRRSGAPLPKGPGPVGRARPPLAWG